MQIRKNYFDFYTPQEWKMILKDHAKSGLSIAAYCREKRIPTSTFYGWKYKLDSSFAANLKDRRDKWVKIIEEWEKSGLSKLEYCKEQEFSAALLSLWQKRLCPPFSKGSTLEKWTEIIEDWKKSGLEKSIYCRKKKLNTSSFYKWEKKIGSSEHSLLSTKIMEQISKAEVFSF